MEPPRWLPQDRHVCPQLRAEVELGEVVDQLVGQAQVELHVGETVAIGVAAKEPPVLKLYALPGKLRMLARARILVPSASLLRGFAREEICACARAGKK